MPTTRKLHQLEQALDFVFKKRALLEQAIIHSSYANENPSLRSGNNERLEFLGDAVLDFIVAEKLYHDYPGLPEGDMTKLRASLVRRETLARIAARINLREYLMLGKGEESSGGRDKVPNVAGAMEAVIAAVYLDGGLQQAQYLVHRLLADEWEQIDPANATGIDYKSQLQELSQARFQVTPVYRLVGESGPDHDKCFEVEVAIQDKTIARAVGKSKKKAETEAARLSIEKLIGRT